MTVEKDELAITLRGVSKQYTKYEDSPALLYAAQNLFKRAKRSKLWAVRGVDLDVSPGECLGVIGRNGAGKSTLLQMLSGVTAPTEGRVIVRGRVAPLISVGVGFHPELSGRENVYVNATILGLTRRQIDERFDAIVDFAEIGDFIDTPVKFYSSGMYVRLGFAVAIQIDPDVLLLDEVLAVGDAGFQFKCYERMDAIRKSGATIVFVTHNLNIIRTLCDRVVLLDHGQKVFDGDPAAAVSQFNELLRVPTDRNDSDLGWAIHRNGVATVEIDGFTDSSGHETSSLNGAEEFEVSMRVKAVGELTDGFVALSLYAADGTLVYGDSTYGTSWLTLRPGETAEVKARLRAALPTGSYSLTVGLYQPSDVAGKQLQLDVAHDRLFHVAGRPLARGVADLGAEFTVVAQGRKAAARPARRAKGRATDAGSTRGPSR